MKFAQIILNSTDIDKSKNFYTDLLGMGQQTFGIGYNVAQAHLKFKQGSFQTSSSDSFFWKLGITLGNLDQAVSFLRSQNIEISGPRQFQDIGYLAHLSDPSGNTIELLQQGFEGNHTDPVPDPFQSHPIGAQATLAHITLRVRDIKATKKWADMHSLRLMSVQPVNSHGFTLYFYAWSGDILPNPNLESVENREWLWRRPYTILELQHLHGLGSIPTNSPQNIDVSTAHNDILKTLDIIELNI